MTTPEVGDICYYKGQDSPGHYLFLKYEGIAGIYEDEQRWIALCLETGTTEKIFWWKEAFHKVA